MEFVNHRGEPLNLQAMKDTAKKSSRKSATADSYHKGWIATGFPPEVLEAARREYATKVERARETGRNMLPWDEDRHMRNTRGVKVRSRPYETLAAAQEAAALAERAGWRGVTTSAVTKGAR